MKSLVIQCNKQIIRNKFSVSFLRKINYIPCVLYGIFKKNIQFFISVNKLNNIMCNIGTYIIVIKFQYKIYIPVTLQDLQYHPVNDYVIHADFYKIDTNKPFIYYIPITLLGKSILVSKGGNIIEYLKQIKIKAYLYDFPDFLIVDISNWQIGKPFLVKDINLNKKKYTLLHNDNAILFDIKVTKV